MERAVRPAVFVFCLLPFAGLVYATLANTLGPDPGEHLMDATGKWALRLLALTLLVSPLRQWTGWPVLARLRRMLGLYAFFYACVHLAVFLQVFIGWSISSLVQEVAERPYVSAGFAALILLVPLAATSTRSMQRRLGRNWRRLHRLVYPAAALACIHLLWQARSDVGDALLYIVVIGLLLGWRLRRSRAATVRSLT